MHVFKEKTNTNRQIEFCITMGTTVCGTSSSGYFEIEFIFLNFGLRFAQKILTQKLIITNYLHTLRNFNYGSF